MAVWEVFRESLLITGFVSVMMMAVEYANVFSQGGWRKLLGSARWRQYLLAVVLGAVPGCLGTFVLVALYSHRVVTFGAVLAGMIASTGDEGFVMFALFPGQAAALTAGQMALGLLLGWLADVVAQRRAQAKAASHDHAEEECCGLAIHEHELPATGGASLPVEQLRHPSALRAVMFVTLAIYGAAVAAGEVGPETWDATRVLLLLVTAFGLWLLATVTEHFLVDHLYGHVLRQHLPKVFLWTLGALGAFALLGHYVEVERLIGDNRWSVLVAGSVIGIIPESGPHLIFTTLYAKGALPLSVLVANTVVQDGHGLLPMLAHSRLDFVKIKGICFGAGLAIGLGMMAMGW